MNVDRASCDGSSWPCNKSGQKVLSFRTCQEAVRSFSLKVVTGGYKALQNKPEKPSCSKGFFTESNTSQQQVCCTSIEAARPFFTREMVERVWGCDDNDGNVTQIYISRSAFASGAA